MKTIVYTAIIGGYDNLKIEPTTGDEFTAFVDGKIKRAVAPWKIANRDLAFASDPLTARWYKMMPHKLFPGYDYSLWIDGSIEIIGDYTVSQLVEKYMQDADMVVFKHRLRNCIYDEAWECIKQGRGDKNAIYRQVNKYTQEGYPSNNGLVEAGILLRRHNEAVKAFNEAWWEEVCNYSTRDQISFDYLAHKMGVKINYFPGTIANNILFKKHPHRPSLRKRIYHALNKMIVRIGKIVANRAPRLYKFIKKCELKILTKFKMAV
jgi:hypothetical protein